MSLVVRELTLNNKHARVHWNGRFYRSVSTQIFAITTTNFLWFTAKNSLYITKRIPARTTCRYSGHETTGTRSMYSQCRTTNTQIQRTRKPGFLVCMRCTVCVRYPGVHAGSPKPRRSPSDGNHHFLFFLFSPVPLLLRAYPPWVGPGDSNNVYFTADQPSTHVSTRQRAIAARLTVWRIFFLSIPMARMQSTNTRTLSQRGCASFIIAEYRCTNDSKQLYSESGIGVYGVRYTSDDELIIFTSFFHFPQLKAPSAHESVVRLMLSVIFAWGIVSMLR